MSALKSSSLLGWLRPLLLSPLYMGSSVSWVSQCKPIPMTLQWSSGPWSKEWCCILNPCTVTGILLGHELQDPPALQCTDAHLWSGKPIQWIHYLIIYIFSINSLPLENPKHIPVLLLLLLLSLVIIISIVYCIGFSFISWMLRAHFLSHFLREISWI